VRLIRSALVDLALLVKLDPSFVAELDPIIQRFRTLKSGDVLLSDDINTINDAIRKIREIIGKIEDYMNTTIAQILQVQPVAGIGVGFAYSQTIDPSIYYKPFNAFAVEHLSTNALEVLENARDIKLQQYINPVDSVS